MTAFIPIAFLLIFGVLAYTFQPILLFTKGLAEWCQSLFFQCLEYILIAKFFFLWFGFGILALSCTYALAKGLFAFLRANRDVNALPASVSDGIIIIEDENLKTAFTHGLLAPGIYISRGLMNSLDDSELKAVYLHELHHKNRRDPLRLFLLSILKDTFFYIPITRFIERFIQRKVEFAADDAVAGKMREPVSLAAALLKIADFNKGLIMPLRPYDLRRVSIGGFNSTEGRIRRLIEGTSEQLTPPSRRSLVASVFVSATLVLSLVFPLFATMPELGQCDTSHCAVHMNKLGEDCKIHCKASEHMR